MIISRENICVPYNKIGYPKVSICFLSWNRFHYFKATVESARECIHYPNLEWIVFDNESHERKLVRYLDGLDWMDKIMIEKLPMASAMNKILKTAQGDYILIWPDDMQFILKGDWLKKFVTILGENCEIGSLGMNCVSNRTIKSKFTSTRWANVRGMARELVTRGSKFRIQKIYKYYGENIARGMGWTYYGVIGAGICSLSRKEVWNSLGGWETLNGGYDSLVDSSLGAETYMLQRAEKNQPFLQTAQTILPVSADIITDSKGTKAKVRKNVRYGNYMAPPNGHYYYKIYEETELAYKYQDRLPLSFEDMVEPVGYKLPYDEYGNILKTDINRNIINEIE